MANSVDISRAMSPALTNTLRHNASYPGFTPNDFVHHRRAGSSVDIAFDLQRASQPPYLHLFPRMGPSPTFSVNSSMSSLQSNAIGQSTHSSLTPRQHSGKVENNPDHVQVPLDDLETDSGLTLDPVKNYPSEHVNDLVTDSEDRPDDLSFDEISLLSNNTSLSSTGIFPSSHDRSSFRFDDKNVSKDNKKQSSPLKSSASNEMQTNGDDLEVDGHAGTEVKMCVEALDMWPQENGCAYKTKAVDMGRRQAIVKPTVNKIARISKDVISTEYKHDSLHRGRCLIISNSEFRAKRDRSKRTGSLRDAKTLRKQFQTLGFHPITCSDGSKEMIHENVSREELLQILSEATNPLLNDHSDFDCFVCVILSYGVAGAVVCPGETEDVFVEINSILEHFTPQQCPSLAMKPKLFFIQGCTPYVITETQAMASSNSSETMYPTVASSLPSMADFLVQFSGVDGCLGWARNRHRGLSFYVQALCKCLKEFCILKLAKGQKSQEMTSLILSINRAFVRILEDDDLIIDEVFCVPTTVSTLTKRMNFYPKIPENDLDVDTG
ncbi:cell death protein 3-like [Mizuhopecten yessoensis]|uniref:Caspase-10 n=1 Tax=Mizuhopecten yessoensis TaxID=6573 RepID=A0A210PTZ0_MIZYE|nr:cell death protein 3-like [Mizuhopecten yessoensis]OWF39969.1 Caspase-10 [Mizuhopecten yessoensis]